MLGPTLEIMVMANGTAIPPLGRPSTVRVTSPPLPERRNSTPTTVSPVGTVASDTAT